MNAKEILHEANMSSRAAFYAGRGATLSDLTDKHLQKIWELIQKHHGDNAAASFVKMVEAMREMSATAFINELYSLENAGWKFKQVAGHSGMDFEKDKDGNYNEMQGMAALLSAFGNNGRDDSPSIRNHFLQSHGVKMKEKYIGDGLIERYYRNDPFNS